MAEERRHSDCAVQMASAFFHVVHTVDFASPFTEDAFVQDSICKFAFEVQEIEFRFHKRRGAAFIRFRNLPEEFGAETIVFPPQFLHRHRAGVLLAGNEFAEEEFCGPQIMKYIKIP